MKDLKKSKKEQELTDDLQRLRADFENYRKRVDIDKAQYTELTRAATIMKLLPIIDTIERATLHVPASIAQESWVQGVTSLTKNLEKALNELGLSRIDAQPGAVFNPNLHEAVVMDDEAQGDHEVIAEELRAGYQLGGQVVRPSMVKVTRA